MARPRNHRKPMGDAAVGTGVVAFMIAGVLFMASIVAVLVTTRNSSDEQSTGDAPNAVAYRIQADGLSNVLLDSPGYIDTTLCTANTDWSDNPTQPSTGEVPAADCLTRLGLRDAQSSVPRMFDYTKFQNLRNAPLQEDPLATPGDGFVNYVEAREGLGLADAGLDFHVRAYPSLPSIAQLLNCIPADACRDPNLRITYIGNITPPNAPLPPPPASVDDDLGFPTVTCTASPSGFPNTYRISTTVTNNGDPASAPVQLSAIYDVQFSSGPTHTQNANGPLLAVGQATTFAIDVPAYDGRSCGVGTVINVEIQDINGALYTVSNTLDSAEDATGVAAPTKDLWIDASGYYLTGSNPDCVASHSATRCTMSVTYKGANIKNKTFKLEVRDGDGLTGTLRYGPVTVTSPSSGKGGTIVIPEAVSDTWPAGAYTAILYDGSIASGSMRVTERMIVSDTPPTAGFTPQAGVVSGGTSYVPDSVVETEVSYLHELVDKFCASYYDEKDISPIAGWDTEAEWDLRCGTVFKDASPAMDPTELENLQPGDVFPADSKILDAHLVCRLMTDCDKHGTPRYDIVNVLIVGTDVAHNELGRGNIKESIEQWVEGGGTLIVFGSQLDGNNWLQPFLHAGTKSSGDGISVPDAAHPILHVPDELDYGNYDNLGQVWDFRGSHDPNERFTQVVAQGNGDEYDPILAVSKPGAMRNDETGTSGTVILTTWQPWDVYQGNNDDARYLEGKRFVNNLLMMGYGTLYLDYGPPIPDNTNVVPAIRTGQIKHPDFDDPIQITMQVFVFPGVAT